MIAGGKDARDADRAKHKPDPHQGPVDSFGYSRVSLAHRVESLWVEESVDRCGRTAGGAPPGPPLPPDLPPLPLPAPPEPPLPPAGLPVLSFRRAGCRPVSPAAAAFTAESRPIVAAAALARSFACLSATALLYGEGFSRFCISGLRELSEVSSII